MRIEEITDLGDRVLHRLCWHMRGPQSGVAGEQRYSVICTNIPGSGIDGVPGSHHPQFIDVLHREHACVETAGVRTAKAMGLRNLPYVD